MSILIHGMEMPKSCHDCEMSALVDVSDGLAYGCQALKEMIFNNRERLPNCPLVPVPPHGRVIDADELLSQYKGNIWTAQTDYAEGLRDVANDIKQAPTVIEAEEGET